jgi:tRNA(His) 5'-end guanylyltransferase
MKAHENASRTIFAPKTYPVIRINGKAFHTWCKDLTKPFSKELVSLFCAATEALIADVLCDVIVAYGQSDEVTLIFSQIDDPKDTFFDSRHDKLVSLTASAFTAAFNGLRLQDPEFECLSKKPFAIFEVTVFSVPTVEEAVNCLIWRQQDAVRNSLQSLAHAHFSHSELQGLKTPDLHDKLHSIGLNWNNLDPVLKRGWTMRKKKLLVHPNDYKGPPEYTPTEPYERSSFTVEATDFIQERSQLLADIKGLTT